MWLSQNKIARKKMLEDIGVKSLDELFKVIPEDTQSKAYQSVEKLGKPLEQFKVESIFNQFLSENQDLNSVFVGAGAYKWWIPPVIDEILRRSEFFTAYTPYQPEVSQGTLQVIYDFQSAVCYLTGMDVANASMYDGATALAEAVKMVGEAKRVRKVYYPKNLHPYYKEVLLTYFSFWDYEFEEVDFDRESGCTKWKDLPEEKSIWIVSYPNFLGILESMREIDELATSKQASLIVLANPHVLVYKKKLGDYRNVEVVVGEGQPFGIPLWAGGPYLGFFAARKAYMRKMPGRIVGKTVDRNGKTAYVLTLQAREQHIKRARATSNICSNEALCALAFTTYILWWGKRLQKHVLEVSKRAHEVAELLEEYGYKRIYNGEFFNEFVIDAPIDVLEEGMKKGYVFGVPLSYWGYGDGILITITDAATHADIAALLDNFGVEKF